MHIRDSTSKISKRKRTLQDSRALRCNRYVIYRAVDCLVSLMNVSIITRRDTQYKFAQAILRLQYDSRRTPLFIPRGIAPSTIAQVPFTSTFEGTREKKIHAHSKMMLFLLGFYLFINAQTCIIKMSIIKNVIFLHVKKSKINLFLQHFSFLCILTFPF